MKISSPDFETVTLKTVLGHTIGVRLTTIVPDRQTVVLIHGIGVSSSYFTPLAKELAITFNVCALDLPGYGSTPKPAKPLSIPELAAILEGFLEKIEASRVTLIGHSMGCQVIADLIQRHPKLCDKAILLSPTVDKNERSLFMQGLRLIQDTFIEHPKTNGVILKDYVRMGVRRYLITSQYMIENHLENNLKGVKIPTFIIRGSRDPIVRREWTNYLQNLSPSIATAEVQNAPHALHYRHAEAVKELCEEFIQK